MKHFKYLSLALLLFSFTQKSKAQAISYYPFENAQQLTIATNPTKAYTRNANFYVGGGTNMGIIGAFYNRTLINGYFGSFGVRAYPFEKASKVSINFETGPFVDVDGKSGKFRAWLGLGYHFGGK
jgi:hypothetical protein